MMSFLRLAVIAMLPLAVWASVFAYTVHITYLVFPFHSEDPFVWSYLKLIVPSGPVSALAYFAMKRVMSYLGLNE